jgi:acyl-CoA synthetase (AMP-forming)/AMP-acid ligase II
MAEKLPHGKAVVFPQGHDSNGVRMYTHFTFSQLDRESDILASGLSASGLKRGMRTVLMVKPSLEFFALTFALFKMGAVPVFVDPGMGLANLKKCLTEAQPHAFIGITPAHVARLMLRWPKMSLLVTVGPKGPWGGTTYKKLRQMGGSPAPQMAQTGAEDMAAILFTSGSTGVPKGAIYSHGIFTSQVRLLRDIYSIEPGEVDLCTFPLFALFAPALGMTAIVPDMNFTEPAKADPIKLREALEDFGCTNMFGSPALLNTFGRYLQETGWQLTTLRRLISAGAPMNPAILKLYKKALMDGVEVFTPYGATECLPVANVGSAMILNETAEKTAKGQGVCVGLPIAAQKVRIIAIDDEPIETFLEDMCLPPGEYGEIVVKGPTVTKAYFNRDASTKLAKMRDGEDGEIWHRMGDIGYYDDEGKLWFCGRKSHRVITQSGTLFTIPCEGVFNTHPSVYRTALVGVKRNGDVTPVLCIELEQAAHITDQPQIEKELIALGSRFEHTKGIQNFLFKKQFPVDIRHNAKIFREKLAIWADKKLS